VVEANEAAMPVHLSSFSALGVGPAADSGAAVVFEFHGDFEGWYPTIITRVYLITSYCAPARTSGKKNGVWQGARAARTPRAQ